MARMRTAACLLAVLIFNAATAAAQINAPVPAPTQPGMARDTKGAQQKTGTATLSGRVFASDSGKPLRRARVRAVGNDPRDARAVSTDADGSWQMKQMPAGRYTIDVSKGGYVGLSYGQRRPFEQGKPVEVADGQVVEKLDVILPKGSVISGRVVDEFDEPLAGVRVAAMRYRYFSGQRRLMNAPGAGASDTTDDIGQYRLHGLSPGDYYVVASFGVNVAMEKSDDKTGYAPTYYPGTPVLAEAQRVTASEGQETPAIGFALEPIRLATVSGTATDSHGKPLANGMIMLTSPSMTTGGPLSGATMIKPDGSFSISNVVPGDYVVQTVARSDMEAIAATGSTSNLRVSEVALVPLTITGGDITGLAVISMPTGTAHGRIIFEGGAPAGIRTGSVMMASVPIVLEQLSLGGTAQIADDWSFEMTGLAGKRVIRANLPTGWFLKSVVLNGADITDTPAEFKAGEETTGLEITLTQKMASVTGTVQTAKGEATSDYVVVLFAADPAKWGTQTRFVRAVRADQSGAFLANGLPAGEYLGVALRYLEPGEEGDPEVLERLRPQATPVSIAEGEVKHLQLKLRD
jgi:protocatechuate 3,4-dioxygenase beta subunit